MTKAEAVWNELDRRNIAWTVERDVVVEREVRAADGKDTARRIAGKVVSIIRAQAA